MLCAYVIKPHTDHKADGCPETDAFHQAHCWNHDPLLGSVSFRDGSIDIAREVCVTVTWVVLPQPVSPPTTATSCCLSASSRPCLIWTTGSCSRLLCHCVPSAPALHAFMRLSMSRLSASCVIQTVCGHSSSLPFPLCSQLAMERRRVDQGSQLSDLTSEDGKGNSVI